MEKLFESLELSKLNEDILVQYAELLKKLAEEEKQEDVVASSAK